MGGTWSSQVGRHVKVPQGRWDSLGRVGPLMVAPEMAGTRVYGTQGKEDREGRSQGVRNPGRAEPRNPAAGEGGNPEDGTPGG